MPQRVWGKLNFGFFTESFYYAINTLGRYRFIELGLSKESFTLFIQACTIQYILLKDSGKLGGYWYKTVFLSLSLNNIDSKSLNIHILIMKISNLAFSESCKEEKIENSIISYLFELILTTHPLTCLYKKLCLIKRKSLR